MLFTPIFQVMELISGIIKKISQRTEVFSFSRVYERTAGSICFRK